MLIGERTAAWSVGGGVEDGIFIHLVGVEAGATLLGLQIASNEGQYSIDWGDGSPTETGTSTTNSHTYSAGGDVTIRIRGSIRIVTTGSNYPLIRKESNTRYDVVESVLVSGNSEITTIGRYAFFQGWGGGTVLKSVDLNNKCTSIGDTQFCAQKGLEFVRGIKSLKSVPNNCFYKCENLTELELSTECTSIGIDAFRDMNTLRSVGDVSRVVTVASRAFGYNKLLESLNLSSRCTTIGSGAFNECKKLTSVGDLSGVQTIVGQYTFYSCTSLKELNFVGEGPGKTMAQLKSMTDFPWGFSKAGDRINCTDGHMVYENGAWVEYPN